MGTLAHDMYTLSPNSGIQFRKRGKEGVESDTFLDIYYVPGITLNMAYLFLFSPYNNTSPVFCSIKFTDPLTHSLHRALKYSHQQLSGKQYLGITFPGPWKLQIQTLKPVIPCTD